jgi:hypothetical protein
MGVTLIGVPVAAGAPSARVVTSTKVKLRFPVPCKTVLTTRDVAKIVKRHVVIGRTTDVDPRISICYYGTFPHSTDDLSVTVDARSPTYTTLKEDYPPQKMPALGNFGSSLAVATSKQDTEVIGFYGSWDLDVKAYPSGASKTYTTSQVMALAQRAYLNVARRRGVGH